MKHNYKVSRRVYSSVYTNIAEQFKIYINSLPPDEIDEIKNDFRADGNGFFLFEIPKAQQNSSIHLKCSAI